VVYATHLLTAADIQAPQTTARAKIAEPRDEHSRPLRLIYGFVSSDARITQPAAADLHFAWEAALKVYRRFLENENTVGVAPARSFALHSRVISKPMATAGSSPRQPSSPHAVSVSTSLRSGARGIAVLPRAVPWFAAAAIILGLALIIAFLIGGRPSRPAQPVPTNCPGVVATASQDPSTASPAIKGSPGCPPSPVDTGPDRSSSGR
jgi:hypothetical protein